MIDFSFFQILFHKNFKKDLKQISATDKQFVQQKLQKILGGNILANIKKLRSYPLGMFRIKIGKFRLLFDVDFEQKIIIFTACKARKDLY